MKLPSFSLVVFLISKLLKMLGELFELCDVLLGLFLLLLPQVLYYLQVLLFSPRALFYQVEELRWHMVRWLRGGLLFAVLSHKVVHFIKNDK